MEQSIRGLTSKEICEIIASAGKHGVRAFRYGDLSIEFGYAEKQYAPPQIEDVSPVKPPEVSPEVQKQLEELRREAELEQIKLNDPLQYEELVMMGEIEDVQDEQVDSGTE